MTIAQARAATSSRLRLTGRRGECSLLEQVGLYDGVYFLDTGPVIRRATISSTLSVNFSNSTTRGLRLGAGERTVRRLYGKPFFVEPAVYFPGRRLYYRPRPLLAPARRLIITLANRRGGRYVTEMSVGDLPEVRYVEGCS